MQMGQYGMKIRAERAHYKKSDIEYGMYLKIMIAGITAILILFGCKTNVFAQDTAITLDSDARRFTTIDQDVDFQNMEPGEERTAQLTITNESDESMNFYISGEVIHNIADATGSDKNAIYEISLYKDSAEEPFFQGIIGSAENSKLTNSSLGMDYLKDDTIIASLQKNESSVVTIKVGLDGDSTENAYMSKDGVIRLNIGTSQTSSVSESSGPIPNIVETVKQAVQSIQTGDNTHAVGYILVAVVAVATIIFVAVGIVKKGNSESDGEDHE